ncbi:MAG: hypothetical protein KA334_01035 [Opitutaceae bacterium]|nr:hypothetical protein [Opitutaceae bacterium]
MGLLERLLGKKGNGPTVAVEPSPSQAAMEAPSGDGTEPAAAKIASGPTLPRLAAAREKLGEKDLAGALAVYEQLLAEGGDRADVLVRISGDLGAHGYLKEIIELVAPRYDAQRHGPATGINVLQAYLALHEPDAAQHVLDILFSLNRPELAERLYGFANAIAEQLEMRRQGTLPASGTAEGAGEAPRVARVNLVTISKPIWFYGLESMAAEVLPAKESRARRVAFAPLGVLGVEDVVAAAKNPAHELGRLSRALPLWFAELLYFSPAYAPVAVLGIQEHPEAENHFAVCPFEWGTEHIRQLLASPGGEGLDYVFTGALREAAGKYEMVLRLWEVKKLRERKQFSVQWTAETASAVLGQFGEGLRAFMEAAPYPAGHGIDYVRPADARPWLDALNASASYFLADKKLIPASALPPAGEALSQQAAAAAQETVPALAWLTLRARAARLGQEVPASTPFADTAIVQEAQGALA